MKISTKVYKYLLNTERESISLCSHLFIHTDIFEANTTFRFFEPQLCNNQKEKESVFRELVLSVYHVARRKHWTRQGFRWAATACLPWLPRGARGLQGTCGDRGFPEAPRPTSDPRSASVRGGGG